MNKVETLDLLHPIEGNERETQRLAWELQSRCSTGWM